MDDSAVGLVFVLWLVVCPLVGYLIGRLKNNGPGGMAFGLLLGPIGWLIAALYSGNLRKCPFCSEHIKPDAKVCRHCGRDLPETPPPETPPTQDRRKQQPMGIWGLVWVICLVLVALLLAIFWRPTHDSKTPEFVTIRQSISLGADMVPAGTRVELVSKEGSEVHIRYGDAVYGIPISATDLK